MSISHKLAVHARILCFTVATAAFNEYNLIQLSDMNLLSDGRKRLFVDVGIKMRMSKNENSGRTNGRAR